jgi:hypothetical protein
MPFPRPTVDGIPLRADLDEPTARIAKLPVYRSYPVPWFVAWVNGVPEFRGMDGAKWRAAVRDRLCWVCGEPLGRWLCFVIGPMCGVNRVSSEPPSHLDCARWSARNCPFLSKPHFTRRENDMPEGGTMAGIPILRNPGVTLLWVTRDYRVVSGAAGGMGGGELLRIGPPAQVEWWSEGKPASRAAVERSVTTGLPALVEICHAQGAAEGDDGGLSELYAKLAELEKLYPAGPAATPAVEESRR